MTSGGVLIIFLVLLTESTNTYFERTNEDEFFICINKKKYNIQESINCSVASCFEVESEALFRAQAQTEMV